MRMSESRKTLKHKENTNVLQSHLFDEIVETKNDLVSLHSRNKNRKRSECPRKPKLGAFIFARKTPASGSLAHTPIARWRDRKPFYARAHFAEARDALDAAGIGNGVAVEGDVVRRTSAATVQIR